MRSVNLLTDTWQFLGIHAPKLIWLVSALLAISTLGVLISLAWKSRREKKQLNRITGTLRKIKSQFPRRPARGTPAIAYDQIRTAFEKVQVFATQWDAFVALLVVKRDSEGHDEYWSTESAESVFNEESVFGGRINRGLYSAFPGIVTGLGLLFTFIAILIALMPVIVRVRSVLSGTQTIHVCRSLFLKPVCQHSVGWQH